MNRWEALESLGGFATRRELEALGVNPDWITVSSHYGRQLVRVRKGWYARAGEHDAVMGAWRIGGRLTCVSALALHAGDEPHPVLHIEVPANTPRLRDRSGERRLAPHDPVVVHWTRYPGPGDRRAVSVEYAERVAERCGTRGAGVPR